MTTNEYNNLKIGDRLKNVEDNSLATITSISNFGFYPIAIQYDENGYFGAFNEGHISQYVLLRAANAPLPLPG